MSDGKPEKSVFFKPSIDTPYNIDFEWWKENDSGWRNALIRSMCDEHREFFQRQNDGASEVDVIDPETGEVTQRDIIQDILANHCAKEENFIQPSGPLTDSVFRIFLANNNQPMSCRELANFVNKTPETILKTLSGPRIYRGIKPY